MLHLVFLASGLLSYSQLRRHKKRRLEHKQQQKLLEQQPAIVQQQVQSDESTQTEKRQIEKEFGLSSLALGISGAGVFLYPPLIVPALGIYAYLSRPILKKAYQSLQQGEPDIHLVYGIALPGILLSGYHLTGGLNYWLYAFSQKILLNAKENKRERLPINFVTLPEKSWLIKEGIEIQTSSLDLQINDHIFIHSGDILAIDGIVTHTIGEVLIENYQLSSDRSPKSLKINDRVLAGQQLIQGEIYVQVKRPMLKSRLTRLNNALQRSNAHDLDRPLKGEALANKIVLPTLAVSVLAIPVAGAAGMLAILESCVGEAMRITIPMNTLNFLKQAFAQGFLIKDGRVLEDLPEIECILLDFSDLDALQTQSLLAQLPALNTTGLAIHALLSTDTELNTDLLSIHHCHNICDKQTQLQSLQKKYKQHVMYLGTDLACLRHSKVSICLQSQALIACHSAKVILLKPDFEQLPALLTLSKQLKHSLEVSTALSIIPGATVISGVFFAHLGIVASFIVYYSGLLAGMFHANRSLTDNKTEEP